VLILKPSACIWTKTLTCGNICVNLHTFRDILLQIARLGQLDGDILKYDKQKTIKQCQEEGNELKQTSG
jgi:hypothetical protein